MFNRRICFFHDKLKNESNIKTYFLTISSISFLNIARFFADMKRRNEAKEKRTKVFIGIVIAIFMVSSIAGVVLYRSEGNGSKNAQTLTLGGKDYNFEQKLDEFGNAYYFVSDSTDQFSVYYMPQQLSSIMDNETQEYLTNLNYFYMGFSPNDTNIQFLDYLRFDLRKNIPSDVYFSDAVTEQSDKYNLPVATCGNASANSPVILLKSANVTEISAKGNCVSISFAQYDSLRIRDMFVYLLRGIPLK
jgi:hypothetical protein